MKIKLSVLPNFCFYLSVFANLENLVNQAEISYKAQKKNRYFEIYYPLFKVISKLTCHIFFRRFSLNSIDILRKILKFPELVTLIYFRLFCQILYCSKLSSPKAFEINVLKYCCNFVRLYLNANIFVKLLVTI